MGQKHPDYIVIADLSPQTQGISIVSAWVIQFLSEKSPRIKVINTSANPGSFYHIKRSIKFFFALANVLTIKSPVCVYVALSHGYSLYAQTIILIISKWKNNRALAHHHTFLPISYPKSPQNKICHKFMRNHIEHILLSEHMKERYIETWNPKGKCWVITNHQIASLRTATQVNKSKRDLGKKICFAGRLSAEKGFWDCEILTRVILTKNSEMTAIFLGPISGNDILHAIEKLKNDFPSRFEHIGVYDETNLSEALIKSTYFLFPSRYSNEASPLVVLEAQSLGNICITSTVGTLATDVLSPGSAVDIDKWHAKVLETIEVNKSDESKARLVSEEIREKSAKLALECERQMKEVFLL